MSGHSESQADPNSLSAIAAMSMVGIIGANALLIMPAIASAIMSGVDLEASKVSLAASAEFAGMALGNLGVAVTVHRWNRRVMTVMALGLMALANLATLAADSLAMTVLLRGVAGTSEGALVALMTAGVVSTRVPERVFGVFLIANLGFASLSFKLLPFVVQYFGSGGPFVWLAGLAAVGGLVAWWMPSHASVSTATTAGTTPDTSSASAWSAMLGLGAMLAFFICVGAVWTYMDRIGVSLGVRPETISSTLSGASLAGAAGAVLVAVIGVRLGRTVPIVVAVVVLGGTTSFLVRGVLEFEFAAPAFMSAWIIGLSYLTGVLASLDATGRVASVGVAMQSIGLVVGPLAAGAILDDDSFRSLGWLAAASCGICALVILAPALSGDSKLRHLARAQLR